MVVTPLTSRPFDLAVVVFLISHIFPTIILDAQTVLPKDWYPSWAQDLLTWYKLQYGDPLVTAVPGWFYFMTWTEVVLQLPFFFIASYAFTYGCDWIKVPSIIYGLCVGSTTALMVAEFALAPGSFKRGYLIAFYLPYVLFPFAIAAKMLWSDESPFMRRVAGSKKKN